MRQIPHLTVRGKPIAMVYEYRATIHVVFADWTHKFKQGETRHVLIDWASEKYVTNAIDVQRFPEQSPATLEENEHEALRVAFAKRLRIAAEDDGLELPPKDTTL